MLIFPYVYPNLNSDKYDDWPIIVIILCAVVFLIGICVALGGLLVNLMSKGDELPILQEPEEPINDGYDNQAVLQGWLEGKDFVKTS
jgi:hypothetical protein